jgi:erythromycin esterase-like protein
MPRYFTKEAAFSEAEAVNEINRQARPLTGIKDLDPLLKRIGNAKIVMLGEASHGTHEYYVWRSYITKRLIEEKGFNFLGVEGDWPDCYLVNRYVRNYVDSGKGAHKVLQAFKRWPTWMWANWEDNSIRRLAGKT